LPRTDRVGIAFGHELECKTKQLVALRLGRRSRKHQAFRATGKELAGPGAGLVAASSQCRDRLESFLLQILVELFRRQLGSAALTAIADDEQAWHGHAQEPGRIVARSANDRLAA